MEGALPPRRQTALERRFFAVIDGKRKELGTIGAMTIVELAKALPAAMIEVLEGN